MGTAESALELNGDSFSAESPELMDGDGGSKQPPQLPVAVDTPEPSEKPRQREGSGFEDHGDDIFDGLKLLRIEGGDFLQRSAEQRLEEFLRNKSEKEKRLEICSVEDCDNTAKIRGWCNRHYHRWYEGRENLVERKYDKNNYYKRTPQDNFSICELQVGGHNRASRYVNVTLIDSDDYDRLSQYKWSLKPDKSGNIYVCRFIEVDGKTRMISMHREVMRLGRDDPLVDHINNNTLDNRKSNLRLATHSQNVNNRRNRGKNYHHIAGYKLPWMAKIYFKTEIEAKEAVRINREENYEYVLGLKKQ